MKPPLVAALLSLYACCAAAGPLSSALPAPQVTTIPVDEGAGAPLPMVTHVFLPPGPGPFPVVLFSHGRPPGRARRAALAEGASAAQLRFWLARGAAVVAPIRPGYGPSPGDDPEQSFSRHDALGRCVGQADYRRTADAATRAILAAVDWLKGQRWADAQHVLLVGQSVGGFATVEAASRHPAGVVGYVNFAGGTGGDPEHAPGRSCDPGQITALYAGWGRATTLPNLWVYAENDQYWGPDVPVEWHAAFARGGSRTTFVHAPAVEDGDGHGLSRHADRLWGGYVDSFLAGVPFLPPAPAASAASR
jgi:dienelactone hydrolase